MSGSRAQQSRLSLCSADGLELDWSCRSHGNTEFKVNALAAGLHS